MTTVTKNEAGPEGPASKYIRAVCSIKIPVARDQETVAIFRFLARLKDAGEPPIDPGEVLRVIRPPGACAHLAKST